MQNFAQTRGTLHKISDQRGNRVIGAEERMTSSDVKLSKTMSWLLRHGALKEGVEISSDGFVRVGDILSRKEFAGCTLKDVQRIVEQDKKTRFCLRERCGTYEIKANQGHSIRVEDLELLPVLSKEEIAGELVHGTYETAWEKIKDEGIRCQNRNHVHMAVDLCAGKIDERREIPGIRSSCEILIYIDLEAALRSGTRFFKSPNGVILSPDVINPNFFMKVLNVKTGNVPLKMSYCHSVAALGWGKRGGRPRPRA
ncbi:unnamed protein product [Notodromas monacha]|uniref:2'-phosphotransferase n=1 Tax=Notodromas monacha TaxID=399045 RepID=A0A7R9GFU4_9CRUS|nr:unnamed protein product [Notodromas monacha]CAG0919255.1 unnamed protein product [Notodromas monacha]